MVEIGLNAPLPGIGRWGTLAWGAGAHSGVALVMFCACVLLIRVAGYPAVAVVMGLSVLTVGVVAFGFGLPRVDPDGPPLWRLLYSLGSRESLVPLGLSTGLLASGLLPVVSAWSTVLERYPILWLIMTFALLSYGMERSGFFRFLAVRTLLLCRGSVPALTVGFFLLSSVLTYFASNDIVVLVMTPLVLELSRQSGIRDVRLLLLAGSYIAANTVSAGLIFGSPSNVIVALARGMDFVGYMRLMAFPTVVAACSSLLVVVFVHGFAVVHMGSVPRYAVGSLVMEPFAARMLGQCVLFLSAIAGYSVALSIGWGFWSVSLVFSVIGMVALLGGGERDPAGGGLAGVWDAVALLPWGIVGFAMSFFMVAAVVVDLIEVERFLEQMLELPPVWRMASFLGGTALLVNGMNDLPASAVVGGLLVQQDLSGWSGALVLQAVLIALNAGCYLSPVGALAGLVWFHMLRRDGARFGMLVPRPVDLFWYGGLHFGVCGVFLCLLLPGAHVVWAYVTTGAGPEGLTFTGMVVAAVLFGVVSAAGLTALAVSMWIVFRKG